MASINVYPNGLVDGITVGITDGGSTNEVYRRLTGSSDPWLHLGTVSGASSQYIDREAASGVQYVYRVHDGTSYSNQQSARVNYNRWWIRHLTNYDLDIRDAFIDNDPLEIERNEHQASFEPLGRKFPIIVKDELVKAARFTVNLQLLGEENFENLEHLYELQTTLLLQSPMPRQWYFVFGPNTRERIHNTVDSYRHFEMEIIEVERPPLEDL